MNKNLSRFSTTTHRAPSNAHSIANRRPTGPAPTMHTYRKRKEKPFQCLVI